MADFNRRIARAGELAQKYPSVAQLLTFYQQLARFQQRIAEKLASAPEHNLPSLLPFFPELISLARREGSPTLAEAAAVLEHDPPEDRLALLEGVWQHQVESRHLAGEDAFFAQALLQPYSEFLAEKAGAHGDDSSSGQCPFCGSKPQNLHHTIFLRAAQARGVRSTGHFCITQER